MINIAIHGAAGRMGRRLMALAIDHKDLNLHSALEHADHPDLGSDISQLPGVPKTASIPLASQFTDGCDVVIDFSAPPATRRILRACAPEPNPAGYRNHRANR